MSNRAYIYAGISILSWGMIATCSKLLLGSRDPVYVMAFSFTIGALFMLCYNWKTGRLQKMRGLSIKVLVRMTAIGSLGCFFYNLTLLCGTARLPAQQAFVINYLWPGLIVVFSCIILKEKFNIGKLAAVVCSIAGVVVVTTDGNLRFFEHTSLSGIIFCLLAAVCYGLYSTLTKREDYDKSISVFVMFATGAIVTDIWLIASGGFEMPSAFEFCGLVYYGVLGNTLSFLTWAYALDRGNTAIIANLAYLTPFVSLLCTHFVLGEEITVFSVLGLLLIVAGIGIQFVAAKRIRAIRRIEEKKNVEAAKQFEE